MRDNLRSTEVADFGIRVANEFNGCFHGIDGLGVANFMALSIQLYQMCEGCQRIQHKCLNFGQIPICCFYLLGDLGLQVAIELRCSCGCHLWESNYLLFLSSCYWTVSCCMTPLGASPSSLTPLLPWRLAALHCPNHRIVLPCYSPDIPVCPPSLCGSRPVVHRSSRSGHVELGKRHSGREEDCE